MYILKGIIDDRRTTLIQYKTAEDENDEFVRYPYVASENSISLKTYIWKFEIEAANETHWDDMEFDQDPNDI